MEPIAARFACTALAAALALADGASAQDSAFVTPFGKRPPDPSRTPYPRPLLERDEWLCLDGTWSYSLQMRSGGEPLPEEWQGNIEVPFPVESRRSGVRRRVAPTAEIWYRRRFEPPSSWRGRRILLHVEASDWETKAFVNGRFVGRHRGGYDPFSFDVTDALTWDGPQTVTLVVWDPTDEGLQPRGKQTLRPHGIWYTASSGIWGTVWLEPVPAEGRIDAFEARFDPKEGRIEYEARGAFDGGRHAFVVELLADGAVVARAEGGERGSLEVEEPRLWSPEDPFLYEVRLTVRRRDDGEVVDRARSWIGLRSVEVRTDVEGVPRVFLNGQPRFLFGALDQGFFPESLHAAPSVEAWRADLRALRDLGITFLRKHVKIEPRRYYFECDRLGMLVLQDFPSGGPSVPPGAPDAELDPVAAQQWRREAERWVETLRGHPSIVGWVIFNEGWGQHDTAGAVEFVEKLDPTRPIDAASGWNDRGAGDFLDVHVYPGPALVQAPDGRAALLGEFGGLGLRVDGHVLDPKKAWGYRLFATREEWRDAYLRLVSTLPMLAAEGLAGAVYTQATDVESEVNGLTTYDRRFLKLRPEEAASLHRRLAGPPPRRQVLVPDGRRGPVLWRYTLEPPSEDWMSPEFDDAEWREAAAPFGTPGTPGLTVRTEWRTPAIHLRRRFELEEPPPGDGLYLVLYHDEDARIFLNGRLVAELEGWTPGYVAVPLAPGAAPLRKGTNVLAVECRQTGGGQGIDVGIARLLPQG